MVRALAQAFAGDLGSDPQFTFARQSKILLPNSPFDRS
jgi:hypothetical protein